jgi:DNA-binding CsgD family transcriptional regulator
MTELAARPIERRIEFDIAREQLLKQHARGRKLRSAHRPLQDGAYGESDPDATRRCTDALHHLLAHRGRPAAEIDAIIADHPHSIVAHCLRLAVIVRDDNRAAQAALAASIAAFTATGSGASDRARRHAAVAGLWLMRESARALEAYGAIVAEQPLDSLALAVAHALDFRLGNRRMLRDRIAGAIRSWDSAMPDYAAILAMYAFGLEENGAYPHAERLARRALTIEPGLAPAIHVLAHVMEMQARPREGLDFLAANEAAWAEGNGFSIHLAWHRALFHLQLNDVAGALAVYDAQIAGPASPNLAALADASALLWRLQLRNSDLGARWRRLAERWEKARLTQARPFFIVHAVMAFAATGRTEAATRLLATLPPVDLSEAARIVPEHALAPPVCEALLAFAADDYAACIANLERVRHIANRCGGSLAQCEVLQLTFAEATQRARKARLAA